MHDIKMLSQQFDIQTFYLNFSYEDLDYKFHNLFILGAIHFKLLVFSNMLIYKTPISNSSILDSSMLKFHV